MDDEQKHQAPVMSLSFNRETGTFFRDGSPEGRYWTEKLGEEPGAEYTPEEVFTFRRRGFDSKYGCITISQTFPGMSKESILTEQDVIQLERRHGMPVQFEGEPSRLPIGVKIPRTAEASRHHGGFK